MAPAWLSSPILQTKWKYPKWIIALNVLELAGTVAALTLFGIADPDLFRTRLWQIGYDNGFNSDPNEVIYAYANYRKIPKIAFVWSQTLDYFNIGISVLSMFIQLCKVVMFIMHCWYPLLGTIINGALTVLWIVSIYGQAGPDHTDPKHPSNVAWYIAKSCKYAEPSGNARYCQMAKGTFAVTVFMMVIYLANTILGIYSLIPSRLERSVNALDLEDNLETSAKGQGKDSPNSEANLDRPWEMKNLPPTTEALKQPFTPRTMAFKSLDRQLPLRATQAPRFA